MGLEIESVELLIKAKNLGVNFDHTLTIGRQRMLIAENVLQRTLYNYDLIKNRSAFKLDHYAESLFGLLGSIQVDALDASDYEGANVIHDLNEAILNQYKSKYDVVFDGGSLEHIFNFPMAVKNCMEMVKVDGHYIAMTPTNNFMGHGFYQFSPELYFRVFNSENGFRIKKMFFYTRKMGRSFYEVIDPSIAQQRVGMVNAYPSFLFVIAQKLENVNIFKKNPQQYEYENIFWKNRHKIHRQKESVGLLKRLVPKSMRRNIKMKLQNLKNRYRIACIEIGTGNPKNFRN